MTIKTIPSELPMRVQLALEGKLPASDLSDDEQTIFFDLLGQRFPSEAERATLASEMLQEAGNVGYDEAGNLELIHKLC